MIAVVELVDTSPKSWEDATRNTLEESARARER
ncbi:MAG TPA: dodecin domain-containing protein [Anaerolineae bacterium]|nr:dodecin domain-containing protein [Anaerolineae bacterium]